MAIPYTPRTEYGSGFLPLISRIIMFESAVYLAVKNEWPMTVEAARASLDLALEHTANLNRYLPFVADTTRGYVEDWHSQTVELRDSLAVTEGANPDQTMTEAQQELVKTHAQQTWALMSYLDKDLIGLTDELTDPGRTP